jgi:hypothetical protein
MARWAGSSASGRSLVQPAGGPVLARQHPVDAGAVLLSLPARVHDLDVGVAGCAGPVDPDAIDRRERAVDAPQHLDAGARHAERRGGVAGQGCEHRLKDRSA